MGAFPLMLLAVAVLAFCGLRRPEAKKPKKPSAGSRPQRVSAKAGHSWPSGYQDPMRWCFLENARPSGGVNLANVQLPYEMDNEFCKLKALIMHSPTHESERKRNGDYPFAWHLQGR